MKKLRKNKKGFTLIEVIVVLVILAIIIALAVPSVMKYIDDANEAKYLAQARAAYIATEAEITKDYAPDSKLDFVKTTEAETKTALTALVTKALGGTDSEFTLTSVEAFTKNAAGTAETLTNSNTKPNAIKSYKIVIDNKKIVTINKNGSSKVETVTP